MSPWPNRPIVNHFGNCDEGGRPWHEFCIAQDKNPVRYRHAGYELVLVQVMCPQHPEVCFLFDADLIETLDQSAEELCMALERSFPNSSDLDAAKSLIVKTLVNSAVGGEREASALKAGTLATLQRTYPSIAFDGAPSKSVFIH